MSAKLTAVVDTPAGPIEFELREVRCRAHSELLDVARVDDVWQIVHADHKPCRERWSE